jgi:hypothetical protein
MDTQGRLVLAPFHGPAAVRQEKDPVAFHQIIQVGAAILGCLPGWKHDQVGTFLRNLGQDEPTGRQEKPAAEGFFQRFHSAAKQFR